ncbi:Maf family protein [Pelagibacteraceae bacterium]|jgi:septum formation protein|nr:Maf family protein [Pelagibacteraceae bacterium]|tara:strand:- start:257 stop:850 length:594 start_codon:yes stop_codon:yes gene_type:complete
MNIHLASKSETRGKLLKNAKISFSRIDHGVDEDEVKISLQNQSPTKIAVKLSELKATQPNPENKEDLVIGSDQVLDLEGKLFNKARDLDEAKSQLIELSGKKHNLITSTVIAQNKNIIWRHLDKSTLVMRTLTTNEIDNYLNEVDKSILNLVGVYAIEQEGIKLFEKIDGDFFSIQGLSVTPLINFLRQHNLILNNE